jgi:hypothetical protein
VPVRCIGEDEEVEYLGGRNTLAANQAQGCPFGYVILIKDFPRHGKHDTAVQITNLSTEQFTGKIACSSIGISKLNASNAFL